MNTASHMPVQPSPIIATKIIAPRPQLTLIPRARLLDRLDQGMQRKLTLIAAPAGYGKTMLLSSWIAQRGIRVAWVALDEGDDDPTRFWTYLVAALQTLLPDVGTHALPMLQSPQPPPLETMLATLINDLVALPDAVALVLDDYHVIATPAIHTSLAYLLDHMPVQLHLYLASRADPPLPLSRMRVRGQLVELRAADLRFNQDEAGLFFRDVMGLPLADPQIAALAARTEGWIASLHLAALSLQQHGDSDQFVAQFTGSHRYVVDYLADEILQRQPEPVRRFLLDTALLDRLTASLCDAVGERTDSQHILETLEQQVLVIPLDEERRWYRYHHLFATFLRHYLQQHDAARVPDLHRRASAWYAAHGQPSEAVQHALASQDWDAAATLIEAIADAMLLRGEGATVQRWIQAMPPNLVRSRVSLSIIQIWMLLGEQQFDALEPWLRAAEDAIQTQIADGHHAQAPDVQRWRGQIAGFRGAVAFRQPDLARAAALYQHALDLLPETDRVVRALVSRNLVEAYRMLGNTEAAEQVLTAIRAMSEASDDVEALLVRAGMDMQQGQLRRAAQTYRQLVRYADDTPPDERWRGVLDLAYAGLADVLYEWNDLDGAVQLLQRGIARSTRHQSSAAHATSLLGLARAHLAHIDQDAASTAIQQGLSLADQHGLAQLVPLFHTAQAIVALQQGNLATAAQWAAQHDLRDNTSSDVTASVETLTVARIWIAQSKYDDALRLLTSVQQAATADEWQRSIIETLALQAVALHACGATQEARAVLERAVTLAEPEGYIRTFVDAGPPMQTLLTTLRRAHTANDSAISTYLDELLAAFGTPAVPQQEGSPQSSNQQLIEPLTERELAVLQCLTNGLSNAEIADELVVAVSTVRTHIKNIYGKLAVRNRVEAVTRAQELGLLAV